jgi:hypothetical protein
MRWDQQAREWQQARRGAGARLGRLFARPRFELWAAAAPGRPLYLEVGGLTRRAARAAAAQRRRERPGEPVVVLDDTGRALDPAPRPAPLGR